MADPTRIRGFEAKEKRLQDKLDSLLSRYNEATKLLEKEKSGGGMDPSRTSGANRLLVEINKVKQELKDLENAMAAATGQSRSTKSEGIDVPVRPEPQPVRPFPPLPTRRPERDNTPPLPTRRPSRPSTVDTQSTSLGRRIAESLMEAIGDTRTMEQASDDARVTKEMEMEREMNVAGRKKGGMVKKKKAPVKKAYGGMVKKKQGGSARKVNMKAGFTRRGCSKG